MRNWLKAISILGFNFWLFLLLLGFTFWFGGSWLSDWTIRQPYPITQASLQVSSRLEVKIPISLILIDAEVYLDEGFSEVEIKTANYNLKKLEYVFPIVRFDELKKAIAQELGIPEKQIQRLIRFEIED
jgi:hypothetical protein